jgi:hypothetical protein
MGNNNNAIEQQLMLGLSQPLSDINKPGIMLKLMTYDFYVGPTASAITHDMT